MWHRNRFELIVSEHLLDELVGAYADPYFRTRITPAEIEIALRLLRRRATLTELTVEVTGVATQPEDDLVLSTALSGGATLLATRDRQLLKLGRYRDLEILPPGVILARLERADEEQDEDDAGRQA